MSPRIVVIVNVYEGANVVHGGGTEVLTQAANLRGLALMNRELIAKAERQEWKEIPASNDKPKARQILLGLF